MNAMELMAELEREPQLKQALRALLLSEELLALPTVVAEQARFLAALVDQVARLATAHVRMETDMGAIKGRLLEDRVRQRPRAFLRSVLQGARLLGDEEVERLATGSGMAYAELSEVLLADAICSGRLPGGTGDEVLAVVEASWLTGEADVARAARRAELLGRTGRQVVAVVVDEAGVAHPAVDAAISSASVRHLSLGAA